MTDATRRACALVATALLFLSPALAFADGALVVVGGSKGKELAAVTAAANESVTGAQWTVIERKLPPERIAATLACASSADARCIGALLDEAGADRLIVLQLEDDRQQGVSVRVVNGAILRRGAEVLAIKERHCQPCRDDILADYTRSLVTELIRDGKAKVAPATLVVRTQPTGAAVFVDGEPVGATDLEIGIYAGPHTVRIERAGLATVSREINVKDGERVDLEVDLDPSTPAANPPPGAGVTETVTGPQEVAPDRPLAPWLLMSGGAALVVGGVVAIAIDQDPMRDSRSIPSFRNTAPLGVGLAAAGAAVTAGGVYWLLKTRNTAAVAPTVSVDSHSAHVGLAGHF